MIAIENMDFVLNQPVQLEESLTCEFKEVKSHPVQTVGKKVDEYVVAFLNEAGGSIYWGIRDDRIVTGLSASHKVRDELKQVIGQKVSAIAPHVPAAMVDAPFHNVRDSTGALVSDKCVLEVRVGKPQVPGLFLTEKGEAYRKTIGGTKKLSGAELFLAIAGPLQAKVSKTNAFSMLARLPGLHTRSQLVQPIIHGRRVLWVDDQPSNNFYERMALAQMGLTVDVATTSEEGLSAATHLYPDVILSDIQRGEQPDAGLQFLHMVRNAGIATPLIFYVGRLDRGRGAPAGAFDITDQPDEILHLVLDVLERGAR
jgi:CheY-like chemotaxis protein